MTPKLSRTRAALFAATLLAAAPAAAAEPTVFRADPPASILTPDSVATRAGVLRFRDGAPDAATAQLAYDQLDLARGIEAFMKGMPATSVFAVCRGLTEVGVAANAGFAVTETLMDARSLFLTPNTTTPYVLGCLDLSAGPVVLEVPPGVLGPVDDAYFRWVTDVGLTGPDAGKGGAYLFLPPGHGQAPAAEGRFVVRSPTNRLLVFYRAFVHGGDLAGAVAGVKAAARVYPLAQAANPPPTTFVDISGRQFNTISANDFSFFEELDAVLQHEPADFVAPETVGLFAAIGIRKGAPFAPDARMTAILTDAVALGNAAARSFLWAPRDPRLFIWNDRQWITPFVGGSYTFTDGAALMLDVRSTFFYYATGITPAMAQSAPGTGSAYAGAFRDAAGAYLDGGATYRVDLPGPIPAKAFWSFTVYDNQTRSLLETGQRTAGVDSLSPALALNPDGSATVWFGPTPPPGREGNWVQTMPGKGWNVLLRLYGPLEPWFDQSWRPGDIIRVE